MLRHASIRSQSLSGYILLKDRRFPEGYLASQRSAGLSCSGAERPITQIYVLLAPLFQKHTTVIALKGAASCGFQHLLKRSPAYMADMRNWCHNFILHECDQ